MDNLIEGLKKGIAPVTQAAQSSTKFPSVDTPKLLGAIVIIELIIALIVSGVAVVTYSASISGSGNITGVGVNIYSDAQGQESLNAINWGNVPPSGLATFAIYVKSTSNTPITLHLASANWNPSSISSALTLDWDYNNATIQQGTIIKIDLTLTATSNAPQGTSFTFNVIVSAMG